MPLPPSEPPPPSRVRTRRYVPVLLQCTPCQALLTRPGIDTHRLTDCTPLDTDPGSPTATRQPDPPPITPSP